jgi:two-component system, sensor histidine kinase and response regulator
MGSEQTSILLAEDSNTQALRVTHILVQEGYDVRRAEDGAAALAMAGERCPDLIVSDVNMPGMSGYELCAAVKADTALKGIPFVLLTSLDTPADFIQGLQAAADRYLVKPADEGQLLTAVRGLLSESQAAEEAPQPPVEIDFDGQHYQITASRARTVKMLLSACDSATRRNRELQAAREVIQRRQEELEGRVRERTTELQRANEEMQTVVRRLEEHEQTRSEFIENVSHELRTPLATMSYSIGNLLQGIVGTVPDKVRSYLGMLGQDCERMKATVEDMLDIGRADTHTLVLNRMKLSLSRLARRTVDKFQPAAEEGELTLTMATTDVPGFVDADPLKLDRVLANVLKNAIQFTPAQGRVEVGVSLIRDDTWGEVGITDNGPGVPVEHLPKLTERYHRVGEFVCGTGLGLALCKEVLDQHGGEIEILSPPPGRSGGTQALIRLPLAGPPSLLAVDDSQTIRLLLSRQLRSHGYDVTTCGCADEAVALMRESVPDLLIVDSVLPGRDGVELITDLKEDRAFRRVPIVMITGAEVDRPKREILEGLRIPVLGKPWDEEELIMCLEDAVYGKHYLER